MGISEDASSVISLLLQLSSRISTHSCPASFHPHLSICSTSYHGNLPKHNQWIEVFEEVRVQYLKAKGDKHKHAENPKSMLGKEESYWVSREPVTVFMHGDLSAGEEKESTSSLMQAGMQVEWELLAGQWSPSTELCSCGHRWDFSDKKEKQNQWGFWEQNAATCKSLPKRKIRPAGRLMGGFCFERIGKNSKFPILTRF